MYRQSEGPNYCNFGEVNVTVPVNCETVIVPRLDELNAPAPAVPVRARKPYERPKEASMTKRHRTAYSAKQISALEKHYAVSRYITKVTRMELSEALNLPENQIKIWFQNRRMKTKHENDPSRVNRWRNRMRSYESETMSTVSTTSGSSINSNTDIQHQEQQHRLLMHQQQQQQQQDQQQRKHSQNDVNVPNVYHNANNIEPPPIGNFNNFSTFDNNFGYNMNNNYDPFFDMYFDYNFGSNFDNMFSNLGNFSSNTNRYNQPEHPASINYGTTNDNGNSAFDQYVGPMPRSENVEFKAEDDLKNAS